MDLSGSPSAFISAFWGLALVCGIGAGCYWGLLRYSPGQLPLSQRRRFALISALVAVGTVLLSIAYIVLHPGFVETTYQFDGKSEVTAEMPVLVKNDGSGMVISTTMMLWKVVPSLFAIKPDDCLESWSVNGREMQSTGKFCGTERTFDLSGIVRPGANTLQFRITDASGKAGVSIRAVHADPVFSACAALLMILVGLYGLCAIQRLVRTSDQRTLALILHGGFLLRLLYMLRTPFNVRGYDSGAHLSYVDYVLQHWSIPAASGGWEFHQAPLYYFASALWVRIGALAGIPLAGRDESLQFFALALSVATLWVCVKIAELLFPAKGDRGVFLLFVGFMAAFPSMVFMASRVTNDVLYTLLAFLTLRELLRWWSNRSSRSWLHMTTLVGLGFLTKANAALLFVIALVSAWFDRVRSRVFSQRAFHLSLVLLIVMTSWLVVLRLVIEEHDTKTLSFGHDTMNPRLIIPENRSLNFYTTFDPYAVITNPFNNNWSGTSRREFFFEYVYRSAFFGEFSFPKALQPLSVLLLIIGYVVSGFLFLGLWEQWRSPRLCTLPLMLTLGVLLAGNLAFRYTFGCPCDQDFRFAILSLVPGSYFALMAAQARRRLFGRMLGLGSMLLLSVGSTLFIIWVTMT